jgi:hypothetical protein
MSGDRWAELERLAKAAAAINAAGWWVSEGTLEDVSILGRQDREFIAAANYAAVLELIAAARRAEGAGQ